MVTQAHSRVSQDVLADTHFFIIHHLQVDMKKYVQSGMFFVLALCLA